MSGDVRSRSWHLSRRNIILYKELLLAPTVALALQLWGRRRGAQGEGRRSSPGSGVGVCVGVLLLTLLTLGESRFGSVSDLKLLDSLDSSFSPSSISSSSSSSSSSYAVVAIAGSSCSPTCSTCSTLQGWV